MYINSFTLLVFLNSSSSLFIFFLFLTLFFSFFFIFLSFWFHINRIESSKTFINFILLIISFLLFSPFILLSTICWPRICRRHVLYITYCDMIKSICALPCEFSINITQVIINALTISIFSKKDTFFCFKLFIIFIPFTMYINTDSGHNLLNRNATFLHLSIYTFFLSFCI